MEKDRRTVLSAGVRSLPVQRGRIVIFPKNVQQYLVGDHGRVKLDLHGFGVSCTVGTDLLVGRLFDVSPYISDTGRLDAFQLATRFLYSQKPARREGGQGHDLSPAIRVRNGYPSVVRKESHDTQLNYCTPKIL